MLGPHGLISAAGFFPAADGAGTIALCPCGFPNEAAMEAALAAPATEPVMNDVVHVTDVDPTRSAAHALWVRRSVARATPVYASNAASRGAVAR